MCTYRLLVVAAFTSLVGFDASAGAGEPLQDDETAPVEQSVDATEHPAAARSAKQDPTEAVARVTATPKKHRRARPGTMLTVPVSDAIALEVRTSRQASLGPSEFRRRASAASNPMAPIGRYEDRASAVLIADVGNDRLRLAGSVFNSQKAAAVPQSVAARLSMRPLDPVVFELSYGYLVSSERHDRGARVSRLNASTTVTTSVHSMRVATTALWGASVPSTTEPLTNSALLESSVDLDSHHNVFGRLEYLQRSAIELGLAPTTPTFDVGSGSLGYAYSFAPVAGMGTMFLPSVGLAGSLDVLDRRLQTAALNPGALLFVRGTVQ